MSKKTDYKKQYRKYKKENVALSRDNQVLNSMKENHVKIIESLKKQLKDNNIEPNPYYETSRDNNNGEGRQQAEK